jgi:hypothetical protein
LYEIYLHSQAKKDLKKLSKREKKRHEQITGVLDIVSVDPFGNSVKLKDEMFQGLTSARGRQPQPTHKASNPSVKPFREKRRNKREPVNILY